MAVGWILDVLRRGDRGDDDRCVCDLDSGWEAEAGAGVGCHGLVGSYCGAGAGVRHGFDCKMILLRGGIG